MIHRPNLPPFTRRDALRKFATGFGMAGFAAAASPLAAAAESTGNPRMPKAPHFAAKAKHVIVIFLQGGLSQVDSFDYKPMLEKYDGKPLPYETPRTEFATGNLMKSPFAFKKYGRNGTEVSELFPYTAKLIDEFCIVRSMISDIPNHGPSVLMMNTGSVRAGRPSMGSWVVYGLGTENQNLPGFIVLTAGAGGGGNTFSSAFLPAVYQGTMVPYNVSDPNKQIQYLANTRLNLHSNGSNWICYATWTRATWTGCRVRRSSRRPSSRWKSPSACKPRPQTSSIHVRRARRRWPGTERAVSVKAA
jgi:Protein of unknown function (DUF1501)